MLIDENIPFRKLGYQSLVAFLRTVQSVRIIEKAGECFVEAIPSEESAHITKLIARQKTVTRKYKKLVNLLFIYIILYYFIIIIVYVILYFFKYYIILGKYSKTNTIPSTYDDKKKCSQ